jgi:hypothetical protein
MAAPLVLMFLNHLFFSVVTTITTINLRNYLPSDDLSYNVVTLVPWYLLAFLFMRWKLMNLQLEPSSVGTRATAAFERFEFSGRIASIFSVKGSNHPAGALLMKELQLQRWPLLFGFALVLVGFFAWSLGFVSGDPAKGGLRLFLASMVFHPCLFYLLPLSIGACAVVTERERGVFGWQHSFPFSLRDQWALKIFVCLSLTGFFSWIIGLNLERVIFPLETAAGHRFEPATHWHGIVSLGVVVAALYASTLSNSTINAFLGGIALCMFVLPAARNISPGSPMRIPERTDDPFPTYGAPFWIDYLTMGIIAVMLYVMAYRNFRLEHVEEGRTNNQVGTWFTVYAAWFATHIFWGLFTSGRFSS